MSDVLMIDGHAYSWRQLCELRRQQVEAIRKARGTQPPLFEVHHDVRPPSERRADQRYQEPSLLSWEERRGTGG